MPTEIKEVLKGIGCYITLGIIIMLGILVLSIATR